MTGPALSPDAALAWLGSLSIDLRATAVVDLGPAAGQDAVLAGQDAVLAGDLALGRRAAEALAVAPRATEVDHGDLLAVRCGRRAVAASVGPHALRGLVRFDLAAAAAALEAT